MIPIKNIYYMLTYTHKILNEDSYQKLATESFHNSAQLCAVLLIKGTSVQLKSGLGKEYINIEEALASLRGKIDINEAIKPRSLLRKQLVCSYDDLSVNTHMNQILKATLNLLLKLDITNDKKKAIKKLLVYFNDIDIIDIKLINWNLHYNRNNKTYQMLMAICYLVVKGLIQVDQLGHTKMLSIFDERTMSRIYESFILAYYRKEHPHIKANALQIPWQIDDGISDLLPIMQTDITLSNDYKVLIIDAKYYRKTLQSNYDKKSIHSHNLYQIFTYVKNKSYQVKDTNLEVAGLLLYAQTNEDVLPDNTYQMSGNTISVKTLNLECDFKVIANQLDKIVDDYFR